MQCAVLVATVTLIIFAAYVNDVESKEGISPFFWQPQLVLNLVSPKARTETTSFVALRGYKLGITLMSVVEGLPERHTAPHLNPAKVTFYTDAYRWFLRHMSLIPLWLYGEGGNYAETIKMWRTRFNNADDFIPPWIQRLFIFINDTEWDQEKNEFIQFTKHAGHTFSKHLRYNNKSKPFDNYRSHESLDSMEPTTTPKPTTTTVTTTTNSTTVTPPTSTTPHAYIRHHNKFNSRQPARMKEDAISKAAINIRNVLTTMPRPTTLKPKGGRRRRRARSKSRSMSLQRRAFMRLLNG